MLFHLPPICEVSGSGSQPGQYTGAAMRFARRCQLAAYAQRAFSTGEEVGGAASGLSMLRPQPEATSASATESPAIGRNALKTIIVDTRRMDWSRAIVSDPSHPCGCESEFGG